MITHFGRLFIVLILLRYEWYQIDPDNCFAFPVNAICHTMTRYVKMYILIFTENWIFLHKIQEISAGFFIYSIQDFQPNFTPLYGNTKYNGNNILQLGELLKKITPVLRYLKKLSK